METCTNMVQKLWRAYFVSVPVRIIYCCQSFGHTHKPPKAFLPPLCRNSDALLWHKKPNKFERATADEMWNDDMIHNLCGTGCVMWWRQRDCRMCSCKQKSLRESSMIAKTVSNVFSVFPVFQLFTIARNEISEREWVIYCSSEQCN